ncbi:hypothetical protein BCR34DRAFT_457691, partial [Clohesyomyces aquaticus]
KDAQAKLKVEEERLGFFPLAFRCPAGKSETSGFGWKMIALLMGVIGDELGDDCKSEYEEQLPPLSTPLNSDREAYDTLTI